MADQEKVAWEFDDASFNGPASLTQLIANLQDIADDPRTPDPDTLKIIPDRGPGILPLPFAGAFYDNARNMVVLFVEED